MTPKHHVSEVSDLSSLEGQLNRVATDLASVQLRTRALDSRPETPVVGERLLESRRSRRPHLLVFDDHIQNDIVADQMRGFGLMNDFSRTGFVTRVRIEAWVEKVTSATLPISPGRVGLSCNLIRFSCPGRSLPIFHWISPERD